MANRRALTTRILAACSTLALSCGPSYPAPPLTERVPVTDTLHGVIFVDDYRWLEDHDSPDTRTWIDQQNGYADIILADTALRDSLAERLRTYMDAPDVGGVTRRGDWEYFTLRRKGEELASIVRRRAPETDRPVPVDPDLDYEVIVDPHPMSPTLTTKVGIASISPGGEHLIYSIRDGGEDELTYRIRNLTTGEDREDGLPRGLYSSVHFSHNGLGFYYVQRSRSEGPRLKYHRLGEDRANDVELFGKGIGPESFLNVQHAELDHFRILTVQHGWATTDLYFQDLDRDPEPRPIIVGNGARNVARYRDSELWVLTNDNAPNNRVVAIDPDRPDPQYWRDILPERDHVLREYAVIDDRLFATYLEDVSSRIHVFEMDGTPAGEIALPDHFAASISDADEGFATLTLSSFTFPPTEYQLNLQTGERTVSRDARFPFDPSGIEVRQVWYESTGGVSVPMHIVHRSDVPVDGAAPTLLTGYGGFNSARTPGFRALAAVWIEMGGIFARPNIRGGSEFGEAWHRDGMMENKQHVFDDFITAAEYLIDNDFTNPGRLAIRGGSNGGLLVAAAFTQRPDLFRAVLCGFPDLDMIRFWTFTQNNNLPALLEYGNASIAEEFAFVRQYSPYQAVKDRTMYPAVMFTTGDKDTRVPPLQARRMTARVQAATRSGLPVILRYGKNDGHAGGRGRPFSRQVRGVAEELQFLVELLNVARH